MISKGIHILTEDDLHLIKQGAYRQGIERGRTEGESGPFRVLLAEIEKTYKYVEGPLGTKRKLGLAIVKCGGKTDL